MNQHLKLISAIIFAIVITIIQAQGAGFVPVRNFTRDVYAGGAQNWCAIQDSTGRMYIGNRDGMMVFDGERWLKAYLANYTTVRSLMLDPGSDRIYAGGSEEFGYFIPDSITGELLYTSVMDRFGEKKPQFTEIWNIMKTPDGKIWFQSDYNLFCLDGARLSTLNASNRISRSATVNSSVYVALENGELLRLDGGRLVPMAGTEPLLGKKITGILPMDKPGHLLLATSVDGLYAYDGISTEPFNCDISDFLKDSQVFSAVANGDAYLFGTVNHGAVVKNFATGSTSYINKESGMQNNTVLNASFDNVGNIWLCLDNGLDYVVYNSPISQLIGPSNDIGAGYASELHGDRMYFGTNQGLYSAPYPFTPSPYPLSLRRELQGQIWSVARWGSSLMVASDAGLYQATGHSFSKVHGPAGTYFADPLRNDSTIALASTYHRFHMLKLENGRWKDLGDIEGYDDIGGPFVQDSHHFIWLPHWRKGVYRLHLDPRNRKFDECVLVTQEDGLPDNHNNMVALYNGNILFATKEGFFTYDYTSGKVVPAGKLTSIFGKAAGPLTILPDRSIMVGESTGINIARRESNGHYTVTNTGFSSLADQIIPGYMNINYVSPHELLVSNQNGFWNIDPDHADGGDMRSHPFISMVYANRDSIIYQATPSGRHNGQLVVPYHLNSLRFDFACPDFSAPNRIEYSSYLENYDSDWTPFSPEPTREYTRLAEGKYIFHLRARDSATGEIKETEFGVTISPPWFRTPLAKAMYILLALLMLAAGYAMLRRWMKDARRQLELRQQHEMDELRKHAEQEALVKDYEIATLKSEQLEHDIKHKSQELSTTTMNLIRKNEILHDIATKIARIQEMPGLEGAPQRQLAKIQTSIEENISHDDDLKAFTQNFDIVYENYTKRLMERHPNLSASDKRMCCYIKMGLSSKEIAPLINISYKSVEMARYRLRKKMELPTDISLSDYLADL